MLKVGCQRLNYLRIIFIVVFIVIRTSNTLSQRSYDLSKQHEELCEEIHETSKLYELRGRWDDAIRLLKIGVELSQDEEGSKRSEAALKSQLGNILRLQRHFDEALPILLEAKTIAESVDDQQIIGDCLFYIGYVYDHKQLFNGDGDYNRAKDYYEQSLAVRDSIGDQRGIGFSLFRIGRILEMQGDDKAAMSYYQRVRKIVEAQNFKVLANYVYAHQGFISEKEGNLDDALMYAQLVLDINREIGFKSDDPLSYLNLGRVYLKRGQRDTALSYYFKSIEIAEEIGLKRSLPWSFHSIADLYYQESNTDSALCYYEKTVSVASELGVKNSAVTSSITKIRSIKGEDLDNSSEER